MVSVLILVLAVLCLLAGLAVGLHLTAAVRWRLLRDFLYVLVVGATGAGMAINTYILWQPAPRTDGLDPAPRWRYVVPALCLLWVVGAVMLRRLAGRWARRRVLGGFAGLVVAEWLLVGLSWLLTAREIAAAWEEARSLAAQSVPPALAADRNAALIYAAVLASFGADEEQSDDARAFVDGDIDLWASVDDGQEPNTPRPTAMEDGATADGEAGEAEEAASKPRDLPLEEVSGVFARHGRDMVRLQEAASFPGLGIELAGERRAILDARLVESYHVLQVRHLILAHARERLYADDPGGALEAGRALLALSDQLTLSGPQHTIRFMLGCTFASLALRPIELALAHTALGAQHLEALHALEDVAYDRLFGPVLAYEEAFGLATIARTATEEKEAPFLGLLLPWRLPFRLLHLTEELASEREKLAELRARAAKGFPVGLKQREVVRRGFLVVSIDDLPAIAAGAQAHRRVTRAGVAMHRCRFADGRFPDSLAALVPRFLEAVPIDPFDGKPLKLRTEPDGAWVIYSVGGDGEDDGGLRREADSGTWYERGDIALRSRPATLKQR